MAGTARGASPLRRVWSPWPVIAVALGWLVVLAVLVHEVALVLQLWIVSATLTAYALGHIARASKGLDNEGESHDDGDGEDREAGHEAVAAPDDRPTPEEPSPPTSQTRLVPQTPALPPARAAHAPDIPGLSEAAMQVLTAAEVAAVLRVQASAVIEAIRDGRMPGNDINGEWRVRAGALIGWLDGMYGEHRTVPAPRRRRPAPRSE